MHLTSFKCKFSLLLAEQQTVKTCFGIIAYFQICNNGDYKFCILKINSSIILPK